MAKLSKSIIFSIIGTGFSADDNGVRTVIRTQMKTLSEDRVLKETRAETYDSDSTCAGRADLDDFGEPKCCPYKTNFWDCTGCHPGLSADCHKQPVFAADYVYDDYGDYYVINLPSRDCFCDMNCKDRGDCCDDVVDTCQHWFSPRVSKEVTFDRGVVKYFHAGVGKTFEEATALCAEHGSRIVQPESVADMEALSDALDWTDKAGGSSFWLPWANMLDGEIAPSEDDSYSGEWVQFVDGTPLPEDLMKYVEGRHATMDGIGTGCTMFRNSKSKEIQLMDAVCGNTNRVICEETDAAQGTAKPTTQNPDPSTPAPTEKPTVEPTVEPTEPATMQPTEAPTTAKITTIDSSNLLDADGLMNGVYAAFGGDKEAYINSLLCSGNNAAGNDQIVTYFDGACPEKTGKVQNAIIKQVNGVGKKIEKEAKKLFGFKHKFCEIQWKFTGEHVAYHLIDFSTSTSMTSGMQVIQANWMDEIKRQLEQKGGKCTNFITKNQGSVKKIVKWNSDMVKKVKLNSNNFEKKLMTTLQKEVTKAKKVAEKANKGK